MIASICFVLTGNLNSNFLRTGFLIFTSLTCMSKYQIPKRIRNNANHISSSIMVMQNNTISLGKLVIKCPLKASAEFVKIPQILPPLSGKFNKYFPKEMVLLIINPLLLIYHVQYSFKNGKMVNYQS